MATNKTQLGSAGIKISKLEAARRQLETAIVMFFNRGDAVSTHTLVAAAAGVIQDVNTAKGGKPMIMDFQEVKPEHRKQLHKLVREAENFFKHADRDPDAVLEFQPESTMFMILDAVEKYHELSGENPPITSIFTVWFKAYMPHLFPDVEKNRALFSNLIERCQKIDRTAMFTEMLPVFVARHGSGRK